MDELPHITGSVHDFDFLTGDWLIASRRLRERGVGSDDWDEYAGTSHVEPRLGGVVNVDEVDFSERGFMGLTIRSFDHAREQWSIYWINSGRGAVDPPVVGGFTGDVGEFYGTDLDDGMPVDVVFHWRRLGPDRAHWDQAFRTPATETTPAGEWEINWIMESTRDVP